MKKLLSFSIIIVMMLPVILVINSCSEKNSDVVSTDLEIYDGSNLDEEAIMSEVFSSDSPELKCGESIDICGEVKFFPLIASQYYYAGALIVYNDKDNLYVTYFGGWWFKYTEFHLYVGTQDGLPLSGGKNPVPGQFAYKFESNVPASYKTFVIPLSEISVDENGCFIIAAHAVMGPHTIWAFADPSLSFKNILGSSKWGWVVTDCIDQCPEEKFIAIKTWLVDTTTNYRFWATINTGEEAFDSTGGWCDFMSVVVPEDVGNYNLVENYTTDDVMGNVATDFTGDQLIVTLTNTMPNVIFEKSYVFYGTQAEFDANIERCPRYDRWQNILLEPAVAHVIEIPLN